MGSVDLDLRTWKGLEYLESISGPGAIAEVVQGYVQDAPVRFGRLKAALAAGDRAMLGRQAHDLKSNSATIGATALSLLAARIEQEAESASLGDLQAWIQAAEAMLPQVFAALEEKVRQYPG